MRLHDTGQTPQTMLDQESAGAADHATDVDARLRCSRRRRGQRAGVGARRERRAEGLAVACAGLCEEELLGNEGTAIAAIGPQHCADLALDDLESGE